MAPKKGRKFHKKMPSKSLAGPTDQSLDYAGAIVPRQLSTQKMRSITVLTSINTITSSVGGVIAFQVSNDPSSSTEWSSVSSLWEEYRTLGFEVYWQPLYTNFLPSGTAAFLQGPIVSYTVRDAGAVPPATYDQAWQIGSSKLSHTSQRSKNVIKMSGVIEGSYQNTRSPLASSAIGFYAANLTSAAAYGYYFIKWLVQFRSRR